MASHSRRVIIAGSLVVSVIASYFIALSDDVSTEKHAAFTQNEITFNPSKPEHHVKPETLFNKPEKQPLIIKSSMGDALEVLNLKEFGEFLNGESANEYLVQAFYTNERWDSFYMRQGYTRENIDQLLSSRSQYLSDVSQTANKYYYLRWSTPPHIILSDAIAYGIIPLLDNGEPYDAILEQVKLEVSHAYGVSSELIEEIAKQNLLKSVSEIETISALNEQIDSIHFNKAFIDWLEVEKTYTSLSK